MFYMVMFFFVFLIKLGISTFIPPNRTIMWELFLGKCAFNVFLSPVMLHLSCSTFCRWLSLDLFQVLFVTPNYTFGICPNRKNAAEDGSLIRMHQIMLHLTILVRSPLRTFPLIDSEWEAAQSILSSLGFGEMAVTVVHIAWAPLYPSHLICIAIGLSVDVIILSHKSLFVSSAVTLTWLPWTDSDSFLWVSPPPHYMPFV